LSVASTAATVPIPGKVFHIDSNLWNEAQIKEAWAPPPYKPERAWVVYGASKAQGEKAVWEFVKQYNPHFVVNAVLPNANFGTILDKSLPAATGGWSRKLYQAEKQEIAPRKISLVVKTIISTDTIGSRVFCRRSGRRTNTRRSSNQPGREK